MLLWLAFAVCDVSAINSEIQDARKTVKYAFDLHLFPQFGRKLHFANTRQFGYRRDCTYVKCPKRFDDCGTSSSSLTKTSVFLVLHPSLCEQYNSLRDCIDVVLGAFRDVNLLFESQLGIHLAVDFVLSPDALFQWMPDVARANNGMDMAPLFQKYLLSNDDEFWPQQCNGPGSERFWDATRYHVQDFGIYHIMHALDDTQTTSTSAFSSTLCTCTSISSMRYVETQQNQNWVYLAVELGKIFHSTRTTEDARKLDQDFVFKISDRLPMCAAIKQALAYTKTRNISGCMARYYEGPTIDPRYFLSYEATISILIVLSVALVLATGTAAVYMRKSRKHHVEYIKLQRAYLSHESKIVADTLQKNTEDDCYKVKALKKTERKSKAEMSPLTNPESLGDALASPRSLNNDFDAGSPNTIVDDADNCSETSEPASRKRRARKHAKLPRPYRTKGERTANKRSDEEDKLPQSPKSAFHIPRIDRNEAAQEMKSFGQASPARKSLASLSSFHSGKIKKKASKKPLPRVILGCTPEIEAVGDEENVEQEK